MSLTPECVPRISASISGVRWRLGSLGPGVMTALESESNVSWDSSLDTRGIKPWNLLVLTICTSNGWNDTVGNTEQVYGLFDGNWKSIVYKQSKPSQGIQISCPATSRPRSIDLRRRAIELNSRNTLFIHLLCWSPSYGREVVDGMLKSVLMHDHYLQYIGMIKSFINSTVLMPGQSRSEASFKRFQALERGIPGDQLPSLWIAERKDICPKLRIRRAVEEDNDDLLPIIERHSQWLRELYGDFYISELISRHPESERVQLVCEHKEVAVGVMILNTQINYEALEESFELSPFAGLRHLDMPPTSTQNDSNTSFAVGGNATCESQQGSNADLPEAIDAKSRVTWVSEDDAVKEMCRELDRSKQKQADGYSQLDILQLLEEEDDEFEYDIVNIDTDLLRLPRLFMTDDIMKKPRLSDESISKHKESGFDNKYILKDKLKTLANTVSIVSSVKPPKLTRYSGRPNAFLIEVFAMQADYDERYGFEMLEAAYELFPDRDYCIMCLPSSHTCFPLLEHFT
ncbi:jg12534, partial [Pararge aegeria aegeria]